METRELLQHLLAGNELQPEQLDGIIQVRLREDCYLDYKRGDILKKSTGERAQKLRRFVAGFANAEGGVLLIGVAGGENGDWSITGCNENTINKDLREWAEDVLAELKPRLIPAPRIHIVRHNEGDVLAIAVDRAPYLVPCIEKSREVYYLRIGHQTPRIDPYLHADLVLGRRQRPVLSVTGNCETHISDDLKKFNITWSLVVENESLTWAHDIRAGIVGHFQSGRPVPRNMLSKIDIRNVQPQFLPIRLHPDTPNLAPMEELKGKIHVSIPLEHMKFSSNPAEYEAHYEWRGAVFILMSNGLPLWVQLSAMGSCVQRRSTQDAGQGRLEVNIKPLLTLKDAPSISLLPEYQRPVIQWKWEQ